MKMPKMKYRGTVMVDIDGVLADFEGKFCDAFGEDNRHLYSLESRYPDLDPELVKEFVRNPESYADLSPIFGGLLYCRQAHQRGWYVLLMTSRDKSLREVTKSWLHKYSVVYHELVFSKNKREAVKDFDILHPEYPVRIVVDDSVSVLQSMPEKYGVAWNQLWNFGYFPFMYYDNSQMKLMINMGVYGDEDTPSVVGVWDTVGK